MTIASRLLVGALCASGLTLAGAKSYDIVLSNPASAGSVQLKAGEYNLKVEGSNAVFTNVQTAQKFTTAVKIENAEKKHEYTAVESRDQNGTDKIKAIELGGSTETLDFGE